MRKRTTVIPLLALVTLALPAPATAQPTGTVTSGQARFQILSPTLVRSEFAGDRRFEDQATYNVVNRTFPRTPYTSRTENGWLVITTSAMTVRYRVGSGPFRADNLEIKTAGTTASPWRRVVCATGQLCEAEDQQREGMLVAADHPGHTGYGFVAGFSYANNSVTATVRAATAGRHRVVVKYANGQGGDGRHEDRTLGLSVDGQAARQVTLPRTADWRDWRQAEFEVDLTAGEHRVSLTRRSGDSGNVNVDSLALLTAGQAYPAERAVDDCRFGTTCEAENGRISGPAGIADEHAGFAGTGFVAELRGGTTLTQRVTGVPAAGTHPVVLRYANGAGGDGKHEPRTVYLNGQAVTLPTTANWATWATATAQVALPAGTSDLSLTCPDAGCHVNLDSVGLNSTAQHVALGGYRRSLDGYTGTNGDPKLYPGLMHRDGWYLLDDTISALRSGTPRADRGAQPYQDGYLFGYGQNYKAALGDLAALTGGSKLLPRWAYGVWYSEYIDRTAADFRDRILPAFRQHGVPLDVLVVDTDYKAHNLWNGWRMDSSKFPDPQGFLDWAHGEGLHSTLNIHPSIQGDDPDFAQAQATAKGKLAKGSCANCYVFDWGDPDQLRAYLELHRKMPTDFWWLDWCCDGSGSSLRGVTPDTWINEQYAKIGAFAFSRGFGSLQAGGYSGAGPLQTGPWAEKRTTLHFTGDTSSTWGVLKGTIAYTSAEGVATGMSNISHDIGGHNDTTGLRGSETYLDNGQVRYTTKMPDDMYARWVQLGAFQPITRLHSNHGDRLPWQYGPAAQASATKFLNLRERLVPYIYTLAEEANRTGVPMVRPAWLEHPGSPEAYSTVDSQFMLGSDVLVAPITTPGDVGETRVWFPPGQWTDYFTGRVYQGNSWATVSAGWDTMPVFLRSGGMLVERTSDVANDVKNPADELTVHVTAGAKGEFTLYEDGGRKLSSRTRIVQDGDTVTVHPARGWFPGKVSKRDWTVVVHEADGTSRTVKAAGKPAQQKVVIRLR
ncbi:TIM-barrel domain-containing protein [Lentzea sp. DG1S-22]|uniref:TIM-barrel domain-containing protein n=1 Tax=Lentzea sp. DG1S-22 TaxID=3108822 RepID=UPI002E769D5E|nr:TIM-barrel domain-containing protein [Lentzea sp. DG1S-22]WVH83097.1 TIM-barrel domain-containing protein [Lentzea sp. DG1S-22]